MLCDLSSINNDRKHAIFIILISVFFWNINFWRVVCLNICSYAHNASMKMTLRIWAVNILTFTMTITDHKEIADQFNIFFSNIGSTLSETIKLDDSTLAFTDHLNNPTKNRFNFSKITEKETLTIINNLKSKNSSGKDEISNKLLKSIKCEISKPLTIIINQSLKTGIFPDALKVAKVKPLFKKGDNCCLNNYRPISVLPTISKIFERVMYIQLYTFFNVNNLLSEQQYGFRSQH